MFLNHLFAFSLLTLAAFQFKSFYERSECVQDFQKKSLEVLTHNLISPSSRSFQTFLSCQKAALYRETSYAQESTFPTTNQKITLHLKGKLKRN